MFVTAFDRLRPTVARSDAGTATRGGCNVIRPNTPDVNFGGHDEHRNPHPTRRPVCRAARSQRIADKEPVAARLGPTLRPTNSVRGCASGRAESSTAAGRLLIMTAASAPIVVVPQRPVPSISCSPRLV